MRNKQTTFILTALLFMPALAFSQTSARDADIDLKMNGGSLAGIAPATGSQALPVAPSSGAQKFIDPYLPAIMQGGAVILGQTDGKARVYTVQGDVKRAQAGSPVEKKLKKGDTIQPGDTIYTGKGATTSITFDENYKNAVHIPENSQAVIVSIEPTEIKVTNGSIYSAVDGLPQGGTWKVSTPAAVAAVRGTLYVVTFIAANGSFYAATVDVPDDGKSSSIDIQEIDGNTGANVPEGKEITFKEGETPDPSLVGDLDSSAIQEILDFFQRLQELRDQNDNNNAPPTSGSLTDPNSLDPAGPGVPGGGNDPLDPLDTNFTPDEPMEEMSDGYSSGYPIEEGPKDREECEWDYGYGNNT